MPAQKIIRREVFEDFCACTTDNEYEYEYKRNTYKLVFITVKGIQG